jgi:hypothetical protein
MIRMKCPTCQKVLGLDDGKAGGTGVCPACKSKFRVPGTKPAPGPARQTKIEEDDRTPYSVRPEDGPRMESEDKIIDDQVEHALMLRERSRAWEEVGQPAKFMKIWALISISLGILQFLFVLMEVILMAHRINIAEQGRKIRYIFLPDEWMQINHWLLALIFFGGLLINLTYNGFILAGAEKMKRLESYAMAMTAAILSLLSFFPIGLFALLPLMKAEVKAQFPGFEDLREELKSKRMREEAEEDEEYDEDGEDLEEGDEDDEDDEYEDDEEEEQPRRGRR